jgi:hypothetical protein
MFNYKIKEYKLALVLQDLNSNVEVEQDDSPKKGD